MYISFKFDVRLAILKTRQVCDERRNEHLLVNQVPQDSLQCRQAAHVFLQPDMQLLVGLAVPDQRFMQLRIHVRLSTLIEGLWQYSPNDGIVVPEKLRRNTKAMAGAKA